MEPAISVRELTKHYTRPTDGALVPVLACVTFAVQYGEFLTVLGPSGAGKTTLLSILAQIETATSGDIRIASLQLPTGDGALLNPGQSGRVGYVTQDDNLLPWMSLLDNVLLPLKIQGILNAASRQHALALLRAVGLSGFEAHYPSQLSGGMRKRAALVRTLVYDPPILLMDEPFGALDAETRTLLQEDLLSLCRGRRKTIVFVTHDISEAIVLGDRALILTASPARVKAEIVLGMRAPRDIRGMTSNPEFQRQYRAIRAQVESPCQN